MCRRGDILTSETESETGSAGETIMFYTGLVIRQAFTPYLRESWRPRYHFDISTQICFINVPGAEITIISPQTLRTREQVFDILLVILTVWQHEIYMYDLLLCTFAWKVRESAIYIFWGNALHENHWFKISAQLLLKRLRYKQLHL